MDKKSVFGLNENYASVLSYAFLFISGIIVFVLEKDNKKVRFNALQSTIFFGLCYVISAIVGVLPIIGWFLAFPIDIVIFVSYLYLIYNAYKGVEYRIPFLGDIVYDQINK